MQRSALRHIHSARTMHRDTARELVGIVQRQHRSRASGQQRGAGHRKTAASCLGHGTAATAQVERVGRDGARDPHSAARGQNQSAVRADAAQLHVALRDERHVFCVNHAVCCQQQILGGGNVGHTLRTRLNIKRHHVRTGYLDEDIACCGLGHDLLGIHFQRRVRSTNA